MPFKDTTDGQTHSYNDGCGMPEHNDPINKIIEEKIKARKIFSEALLSIAKQSRNEALKEAEEDKKELYDALRDMFDQYCPDGDHGYISAGENAEIVLNNFSSLRTNKEARTDIKEEKYKHQDGDFSKVCDFKYCRCKD